MGQFVGRFTYAQLKLTHKRHVASRIAKVLKDVKPVVAVGMLRTLAAS